MLKENIKSIRKSKGLSQEELAIKLNVVRQTISRKNNRGGFDSAFIFFRKNDKICKKL